MFKKCIMIYLQITTLGEGKPEIKLPDKIAAVLTYMLKLR